MANENKNALDMLLDGSYIVDMPPISTKHYTCFQNPLKCEVCKHTHHKKYVIVCADCLKSLMQECSCEREARKERETE
jgi:hypothetical protein